MHMFSAFSKDLRFQSQIAECSTAACSFAVCRVHNELSGNLLVTCRPDKPCGCRCIAAAGHCSCTSRVAYPSIPCEQYVQYVQYHRGRILHTIKDQIQPVILYDLGSPNRGRGHVVEYVLVRTARNTTHAVASYDLSTVSAVLHVAYWKSRRSQPLSLLALIGSSGSSGLKECFVQFKIHRS